MALRVTIYNRGFKISILGILLIISFYNLLKAVYILKKNNNLLIIILKLLYGYSIIKEIKLLK